MKFKLTVEGRTFEVEVSDLHTQPIIATLDGEPFEVWTQDQKEAVIEPHIASLQPTSVSLPPVQRQLPSQNGHKAIYAPIPGVIISLSVKPGDSVAVGQELCILEAMKMKNIIYASHAGEIAAVQVTLGQQVKHHETMMEYTE